MDEEETKIKMDDCVDTSPALEGILPTYLLTCGRRRLVSGTQNEIVVS